MIEGAGPAELAGFPNRLTREIFDCFCGLVRKGLNPGHLYSPESEAQWPYLLLSSYLISWMSSTTTHGIAGRRLTAGLHCKIIWLGLQARYLFQRRWTGLLGCR